MVDIDVHSRSRLAGYTPEILFNSRILIVGLGALGQNLALDLALAGVGELILVDFDSFVAHNATKSPLYPTKEEQTRCGKEKAKVVAHKLLPMMTAPSPRIRYMVAPIQSLGALPFLHAQIVFSAVDNQNARAYLAERCHLVGRPLIEGGLHTGRLNISICGPHNDDPCYRCFSPGKTGAFSCLLHALMMEQQQILPAIQNTAAVLAGLQAEAGIQWLHGDRSLQNKYIYGDIRAMTLESVRIERDEGCQGIHYSCQTPKILEVGGEDTLAYFLKAVESEIGEAEIYLPDVFVVHNFCTKCDRLVEAYVPAWDWLLFPCCIHCGGPFQLAPEYSHVSAKQEIHTSDDEENIVGLKCKQVGLPSGTICEIWPITRREELGERYFVLLQGSIDGLMEEVVDSRYIASQGVQHI